MTDSQKYRMRLVRAHMDYITAEINIDMPEALVEKQKAKAIKQAKKLLQREGLLPPDEPVAS